MGHPTKTLVMAFVVAAMMGMPGMAQDVEPPFTWEGKGVASLISERGTEEINFQFEMSIDEQGMVTGKATNEDGVSRIRHVFYGDRKQYEVPGFFARKIVIVLLLDEYGNNPMLSVLNGRVLGGAIWCSRHAVGFLRTKKEYDDFRLTLEWRWPEKPGNSGILLRMSGEEKVWPLCMEAQLMHRRAGDFVGMGCHFNEDKAQKGGPISYTPRLNDSNEKEPGGWNTYEITCRGDTIEATVNGQLQNRATGVTLRKGHIGLQSEGVPIMFRDIRLTPLR